MRKIFAIIALTLITVGSAFASDSTKVNLNKKRTIQTVDFDLPETQTVLLKGVVDDASIPFVINRMKEISSKSNSDIFLVLNSPGGSVTSGMELVSFIKSLKNKRGIKTTCIVESGAASMAAIILAYCDKSYAHKYANVMHHQAGYGVRGQQYQVLSRVKFINKYLTDIQKELAEQLGMSYKDYSEIITNEWWVSAQEAAEIGLVDGVVDNLLYTAEAPPQDVFGKLLGDADYDIVENPLKNLDKKTNVQIN